MNSKPDDASMRVKTLRIAGLALAAAPSVVTLPSTS
jgi:hypothetical protein